ncbi:MAG: low specificity L-threonine aldolase [Rhodospirillaceae bacterium]|nr:low specificity L-threonine aldolase [Rhodospirillaceae bacterium]|tara:strand:- start:8966 stop:10012 length:1047 start_codon:yes stop_codon:yes gene_type:complete
MAKTHFGSDNVSGIAPEILDAIARANHGGVDSYGGDDVTASLEKSFGDIFETEVSVLPVGTGTIANCLAVSFVAPPWGAVYCHRDSHIMVDEANGPEFFSGGAKLADLPGDHGRLDPVTVRAAATAFDADDVHHPMRAALSITQATEWGTLYSLDQVRELGTVAGKLGMDFHMDGARFANAIAAMGCTPAELTWKAGVDVLSFGATKNGCLAVEALVVFGAKRKQFGTLRRLHKRAGQLYSKMRFFSTQLDAYLADNNWLSWAGHANAQAKRLSEGLCEADGVDLLHPVEANEIFLSLPESVFIAMQATGFGFYPIASAGDGTGTIRLVTAFDTDPADVETLIAAAKG